MTYEAKTKPTVVDPHEFIAAVEHPTRRQDAEVLVRLMSEASGQEPVMWGPSIIGFGKYRYEYASGHSGEAPSVGFSPRKAHLVLYVLSGTQAEEALLGKLGKHRRGKSCLYVNKLADVDLDVLQELIRLCFAKFSR